MKRAHDTTEIEGTSDRVVALARAKAHMKRAGTWMQVDARACRERNCRRLIADHAEPCRACGEAVEHHAPGEQDMCWEGRARMAKARLAAGSPLDHADHEALSRFPNPRSPWPVAA